jgi:ATP-binding cassette subfamily B (MDR/TAP) protein 1
MIVQLLSMIKDVNVIYVMGDGLILEHGTCVELLSHGYPYSSLDPQGCF